MKLIKNANILQADHTYCKMDVAYDETGIKEIKEHLEIEADEIIDANGLVLLPGLIDVHVHLREPGNEHKETIKTGTMAAAHGGFTTVMAMPNVIPYPDNVETMKAYLQKIKEDAIVNVIPYGCITKGEKSKELSDIAGLSKLGIHAFSDDGVGVASKDMMKAAMEACKKENAMIVAHTEDMDYRKPGACMHEGIRNKELGYIGIPSACEYAQMLRDLKLAKETGVKYHVCHMSAKESVQYLKEYKDMGVDCSGEVTVHHLLLNEMDVENPNHKMNPPLRGKDDQEALIQGLLDGTIDMIANDHAPHSEEEKNKGMVESPFGIVSIETAFPLLYTHFVKDTGRFTMNQLVHFMSEAPAKRFGFEKKGKLAPGYDADMILVDIDHKQTIDKEKFFSKGKNTPFDGWEVYGNIVTTIVNGTIVYKEERK
ncbi:dihydroorotase [Absiella sp. AM29-15]|uniref:dihydroorotase n=1 Tax=Absiella sp. AM29-15 TaxID=2292278 RepID=UPI000E411583|nr:dihydroorotase [Absiella sp. AM29-15]RGC50860.1 dihydroorotase [Absiella sp. AM29-15]